MRPNTFAKLSLLAFGLVLVSFIIMGTSRLVFEANTARLLSAPTMLTAAVLILFLTFRSVLAVSGVYPLEE